MINIAPIIIKIETAPLKNGKITARNEASPPKVASIVFVKVTSEILADISVTILAQEYTQFFYNLWNKIDSKWLKFTPRAEGVDSIGSCKDGLDNDYDGLIDANDTACQ